MSKRYLPRRKLQDNFLLGRKFPILIIIWNKLETFSSVLKNLFFLSAKCQLNLKKTPAPRNVSAPTFPFCCYCSFQTFVSLTGTLAGNTWFQSALPSVPVLNWTVSCTQTQPQRKSSGPTHRLRSKYLSVIFKALRDLGPMHFADFSSWDALVIQCPVTLDTSLAPWYVRYSFAPVTSSIWALTLSLFVWWKPIHPWRCSHMEWNPYKPPYLTYQHREWLVNQESQRRKF